MLSRRAIMKSAGVLLLGGASSGSVLPQSMDDFPRVDLPYPAFSDWREWMRWLPDVHFISQLTIPGTHESVATTGGVTPIVSNFVICQTASLTSQLNGGIRFFDIRARVHNGVLAIHHGPFYQHLAFGDVIDFCQNFLRAHPSETILLKVKQEYSSEPDEVFVRILLGYIYGRDVFHVSRKIPRLSEVRGKIVLISEVDDVGGLNWKNPHCFDKQGDWNIASWEKKIEKISMQLQKAKIYLRSGAHDKFYVNALNASYPLHGRTPRYFAEKINPRTLEMIVNTFGPYGLITMDFADDALVGAIIKANFRT